MGLPEPQSKVYFNIVCPGSAFLPGAGLVLLKTADAAENFLKIPIARRMRFATFHAPLPNRNRQIKTINRQLFFVWLHNAFEFD